MGDSNNCLTVRVAVDHWICLSSTGASCVTAFAVEDWKLEMFEVFVLEIEN